MCWIRTGSLMWWMVMVQRVAQLKLFKRRVRLDVRKYKFRNRVCDEWNGLAEEVKAGNLVINVQRLNLNIT